MMDISIVHLNKGCFNHCLCHLELGVLQQLKLLQGLGMIHRSQIVYESYSLHDNNAVCFVTLTKKTFQSVLVAISFVVIHTCTLYLFTAGCHEGYDCSLNKKFTLALPSEDWSTAMLNNSLCFVALTSLINLETGATTKRVKGSLN